MEQDIRRPDYVPRAHNRSSSTFSCLMAAVGLTVMTLCLVGAAAAISAWAVSELLGLSQNFEWGLIALFEIPVLWVVVWTFGRAWHIERRIAAGKDMDPPVFKMLHYFRKPSGSAS